MGSGEGNRTGPIDGGLAMRELPQTQGGHALILSRTCETVLRAVHGGETGPVSRLHEIVQVLHAERTMAASTGDATARAASVTKPPGKLRVPPNGRNVTAEAAGKTDAVIANRFACQKTDVGAAESRVGEAGGRAT